MSAAFPALLAVLEAARASLAPCGAGGFLGRPECAEPAVWTFGSPNVALCRLHGREHEGRTDLWPHRQLALVAAVAAADGALAAVPRPAEEAS